MDTCWKTARPGGNGSESDRWRQVQMAVHRHEGGCEQRAGRVVTSDGNRARSVCLWGEPHSLRRTQERLPRRHSSPQEATAPLSVCWCLLGMNLPGWDARTARSAQWWRAARRSRRLARSHARGRNNRCDPLAAKPTFAQVGLPSALPRRLELPPAPAPAGRPGTGISALLCGAIYASQGQNWLRGLQALRQTSRCGAADRALARRGGKLSQRATLASAALTAGDPRLGGAATGGTGRMLNVDQARCAGHRARTAGNRGVETSLSHPAVPASAVRGQR